MAEIELRPTEPRHPIVIALDGGSGAGKSTIAEKIKRLTNAALVTLDDFYQTHTPETEWLKKAVPQRFAGVFEWNRVRHDALIPLRAGRPGRWQAFDFLGGLSNNGRYVLKEEFIEVTPAPVIILEGNFSASPFLRDLIDLAVLIDVPVEERHSRTARRDGAEFLEQWQATWDEVENYYYTQICPPESYDLIVPNQAP